VGVCRRCQPGLDIQEVVCTSNVGACVRPWVSPNPSFQRTRLRLNSNIRQNSQPSSANGSGFRREQKTRVHTQKRRRCPAFPKRPNNGLSTIKSGSRWQYYRCGGPRKMASSTCEVIARAGEVIETKHVLLGPSDIASSQRSSSATRSSWSLRSSLDGIFAIAMQDPNQLTASLTGLPTRLSISTRVSMVNLAVFLFTTSDTRGRETIRISAASACFK
jgi:hypothetical protein